MADDDYAVNNLTVSEQAQFNKRGGVDMVKQATFYLGDHGPFTKQYPVADYTPQKLADDIATEQAGLKAIDDLTSGGS